MRPPAEFNADPEELAPQTPANRIADLGDGTIIDAAARRARLSRQRLEKQRLVRSRWRDKALHGEWAHLTPAERDQLAAQRESDLRARREAAAAREEAKMRRCPPAHWGLTAVTVLLTVLSVPFIFSASTDDALSHHKGADYYLWKQLIFVVAGLVVMFVASRLHPRKMPQWAKFLYGVAIVGLLLTKFSPLGIADQEGIRRWLKLGPVTFQVSELAKVALIGMVANYWSGLTPRERRGLEPWLVSWVIAAPLMGLVFLQPHLSAAMMLFLLPCGVAFFAGAPWQRMAQIGGGLAGAVALVVLLCVTGHCPGLKDYQQERIRAFVVRHADSDTKKKKDYQDANYQAEQGMNALRHGGLLGTGPGASLYKHGHVPEPYTDFILAIIGEEWGLIGTMALLTAFGALIFFCFQIGFNACTSFEALFCAGVGTMLAIQVIFNTGVVTGLLPVTGVVLPLLSYGGSGLVVMLFAIGQVLGISRRQCEIE